MLEVWGMRSMPPLSSLLGPFWSGVVAPVRVLSMGQVELNCVLMLNWIAWKRTVLTFELHSYAKLNCLKCNWIVKIGISFWHRNYTYAKLNCCKWVDLFRLLIMCKQKLYLYETLLFNQNCLTKLNSLK